VDFYRAVGLQVLNAGAVLIRQCAFERSACLITEIPKLCFYEEAHSLDKIDRLVPPARFSKLSAMYRRLFLDPID
jgi:hypothetical protein